MAKSIKGQTAIPNTLDCGEATGWALWRLSNVLQEIANNDQAGASSHNDEEEATEATGSARDNGQSN